MAWTKMKTAIVIGVCVFLAAGTVTIQQIRKPKYDPNDFQATTYPTGSPEMMQYLTNNYGHPLNYTFPITAVQLSSINGLLNQCMEVSGWRYLMDKEVAAGSVKFGCPKVYNGEEWVDAFESALQTNKPEWWVAKKNGFRRENLVLIRFPKERPCWFCRRKKPQNINSQNRCHLTKSKQGFYKKQTGRPTAAFGRPRKIICYLFTAAGIYR